MNIFMTDDHPYKAAENLDDKRVCKMIIESMQLFNNVIHKNDLYHLQPISPLSKERYKIVFPSHPCSLWLGKSLENYMWLRDHMMGLFDVYESIYKKEHSLRENVGKISIASRKIKFSEEEMLPLNCSIFKNQPYLVGYRLTMVYKWIYIDKRMPKWTGRNAPEWCYEYCNILDDHLNTHILKDFKRKENNNSKHVMYRKQFLFL